MGVLIINVPANCEQYKEDIRRFVDLMLHKLGKNAHKGRWEDIDLATAFSKLTDEVDELCDAVNVGNSTEIQLEAADVANFALITAAIAIERGK